MAQQTINVGAAPNDGTGTPLRTAFQYTNSNFTELYTALGGGSGLPGASGQLIFNNGTSLAGDNELFYNATTNTLTTEKLIVPGNTQVATAGTLYVGTILNPKLKVDVAGTGETTIASATISGDLTVRTNKLVVNATGVGAGKTPSYPLDVAGNVSMTGNGTGTRFLALLDETNTYAGSLTIQAGGGSAGFGGGIVLYGHSHATYPGAVWIGRSSTSSGPIMFGDYGTGPGNKFLQLDTGGVCTWYDGAGGTRMTLNSSGNVGIGVTPSAWSGTKALQIGSGSAVSDVAGDFHATANAYNTTTGWVYISNAAATDYYQRLGAHVWRTAGAATGAIAWTQAMTLDASGNLLVGTTDAGSNSGIGLKAAYSATAPYFATVGSSTSASEYSYLLYSTGGTPAFKFYVSYSGQISATSGTVAALSDARFKENIQDIDVGLGAILALKPRKFDWKAGRGKDIKGDRGFIAQEFEEVFPNLIDEWADPAPEGEAPYKSVRQDLIPVLVKAIQELAAEVNALKNA